MLIQCFYNSELMHGYIVQPDEVARAHAELGLKMAMFARCQADHPAVSDFAAFEIVLPPGA